MIEEGSSVVQVLRDVFLGELGDARTNKFPPGGLEKVHARIKAFLKEVRGRKKKEKKKEKSRKKKKKKKATEEEKKKEEKKKEEKKKRRMEEWNGFDRSILH